MMCVGRPLIDGDDISMTVHGLKGNHVRIAMISEAIGSLRRLLAQVLPWSESFYDWIQSI